MAKLQMLYDQVLIKPEEEDTNTTSILLPDSAKKKPTKGKVVAVGSGVCNTNACDVNSCFKIPLTVKEGDVVLYRKWAGTEVKYQEEEYIVLKESEIIAIIEA